MKKIWTLALAGILSSTIAMASMPNSGFEQNPEAQKPDPEEMVDKAMEELEKKLSLSTEKSEQIRTILLDFHKQIPETRKNGEKEMKTLEDKTNEKVKALLSDEEYDTFLETMKSLKPTRPARGMKRR